MLEWTGERFLPERNDPTLAYEHLHRYFYATQFARDKKVLDLASGEGYGANLLARIAGKVVGVDIAPETIEHARQRYGRSNLEFLLGSITKIPIAESHIFDLIVCFEAIEHIADQEGLLAEVVRLLQPDGIFIVSTPNKPVYDQANAEENAFHVKELEFDEFRNLIESRFKHVRYLGQRVYAQSNLWPLAPSGVLNGPGRSEEFLIERIGSEFQSLPVDNRIAMYHVAVASNAAFDRAPGSSILVDNSNALVVEKDREIQKQQREYRESLASAEEALRWRESQIEERDKAIQWLGLEVENLKREMAAQKEWYEKEVNHRDATIASHEEGLAWRAGQVNALETEKADLIDRLKTTSAQLGHTTEQLEAIHASSSWKVLLRIRRLRDTLMPSGSPQRRLFDFLMHSFSGKS